MVIIRRTNGHPYTVSADALDAALEEEEMWAGKLREALLNGVAYNEKKHKEFAQDMEEIEARLGNFTSGTIFDHVRSIFDDSVTRGFQYHLHFPQLVDQYRRYATGELPEQWTPPPNFGSGEPTPVFPKLSGGHTPGGLLATQTEDNDIVRDEYATSYLPNDIVTRLEAFENDNMDCKSLRKEFEEMGQTLLNLDQRLITDGLFVADRLLRIWEDVNSTRADVSQEVRSMTGTLEGDVLRYGDLHNQAQDLEEFFDQGRAACGIDRNLMPLVPHPSSESNAAPRLSR